MNDLPSPRLPRGLAWLILGLTVLAGTLLVPADVFHPEWDGSVYLLTARTLAAGEGYVYQDAPFFLRPPGLSWILSFLVGSDEIDFQRVNAVLMLFAGLSALAIFAAFRSRLGDAAALGVALLSATSPLLVRHFNHVLSEFPFLAFSFAGVALLERALGRRSDRAGDGSPLWGTAALAALCLVVAVYMRTVAILVLPALMLALPFARGGRRLPAGLVALALVAALVPWVRHSAAAAASAPVPSEQLYLHDYSTAMFHVDPGDPGSARVDLSGWWARARSNATAAASDLAAALHLGARPAAGFGVTLLLLLGLGFAFARGPGVLEWLTLGYVALVLTYFTYDIRLLAPLAPLAYGWIAFLLTDLARRTRPRVPVRWLRGAAAALGLALLAGNAARFDAGTEVSPEEADTLELARWVRDHTPPDAALLCNQAPTFALLCQRETYTYRFARSPGLLQRYPTDFVVFDRRPPPSLWAAAQRIAAEVRTFEATSGTKYPVARVAR